MEHATNVRLPHRAIVMAFAAQVLALVAIAIVALDLYAHKRVETIAGLNIWGYRGTVAHQKEPREIRLVVVGGTRAFGLGTSASWTTATVVRQEVMLATDRPGHAVRQVVALTLAWPGALPDSYAAALRHFAYLQPDYICIYDDLGVGGSPSREEQSGIFARTGYWPALPVVLQEKGMRLRYGNVGAGYEGGRASNSGTLARAAGVALQFAGQTLSTADRLIAAPPARHRIDSPALYATEFMHAVDVALSKARGVVVAISPVESPLQASNGAALFPLLTARAAETKRLRVVNLAEERMLFDRSQRLDDWNYGGNAIAAVAKRIAPPIIELITAADSSPR